LTYTFRGKLGRSLGVRGAFGLATAATLIALPAPALGAGSGGIGSGGTGDPATTGTTTPGAKAKLVDGVAIPPAAAPPKVVRAIEAANSIIDKPYVYGGGHAQWRDKGYDCSGTASFALGKYGARVLDSPLPSGDFQRWGERGKGAWITAYANPGHMFLVIAGLRLDTSTVPGNGPGWSEDVKAGMINGPYRIRHPRGL
jgi:cell wall-associated NlpC family hydrolase